MTFLDEAPLDYSHQEMFGPFLAAFAMTGAIEGREGVRRLRRRCLQVRVGWQW
jgi:hypothetical protein